MERITIILLLVLASCSVKNEEDKETTQEITTNDVPVISDPYYDSLVRTFEPQIRISLADPKIKWLSSEPQGIGKCPDEYIKVIEENFCNKGSRSTKVVCRIILTSLS